MNTVQNRPQRMEARAVVQSVPKGSASASLRDLFKMPILRPCPRPPASKRLNRAQVETVDTQSGAAAAFDCIHKH